MKQNVFNTGTANIIQDTHKRYIPLEFSHVSKVSRHAVFFNCNGVIAMHGSLAAMSHLNTKLNKQRKQYKS